MNKIPIGVSQCLLGDKVRYDGTDKYNACLVETLGDHLEFHAVCPELAIGLGAPRPPIRLIATDSGVRVRGVDNPEQDFTAALEAQAELTACTLPFICGFVFTEKSPSCGISSTKVYSEASELVQTSGQGIFAKRLTDLVPQLPVIESVSLADTSQRTKFLHRVKRYYQRSTGALQRA